MDVKISLLAKIVGQTLEIKIVILPFAPLLVNTVMNEFSLL